MDEDNRRKRRRRAPREIDFDTLLDRTGREVALLMHAVTLFYEGGQLPMTEEEMKKLLLHAYTSANAQETSYPSGVKVEHRLITVPETLRNQAGLEYYLHENYTLPALGANFPGEFFPNLPDTFISHTTSLYGGLDAYAKNTLSRRTNENLTPAYEQLSTLFAHTKEHAEKIIAKIQQEQNPPRPELKALQNIAKELDTRIALCAQGNYCQWAAQQTQRKT